VKNAESSCVLIEVLWSGIDYIQVLLDSNNLIATQERRDLLHLKEISINWRLTNSKPIFSVTIKLF